MRGGKSCQQPPGASPQMKCLKGFSFNYSFPKQLTNLFILFFLFLTRFYIVHVFFQSTNTRLKLFSFFQDIPFLGEIATLFQVRTNT